MEFKQISHNGVGDSEYGNSYEFYHIAYEEKPYTIEEILEAYNEEYRVEVNSAYDCTGRWFTSSIVGAIVDNNTWDNVLTVAIVHSFAKDI